jgi:hypothetical protein
LAVPDGLAFDHEDDHLRDIRGVVSDFPIVEQQGSAGELQRYDNKVNVQTMPTISGHSGGRFTANSSTVHTR